MNKRPVSIAIIGWLFIAVGTVGVVRGLWPLVGGARSHAEAEVRPEPLVDSFYSSASGIVAAVGGAYLLQGRGWARWLLVAWMAFHIVLSVLHSMSELAVHCMVFGAIIWFLFRPHTTEYFQNSAAHSP